MVLAPARPKPKPSQSASRSAFSSQREADTESALMHYRARSYDPRTGRFIQKDPLRRPKHARSYEYVSGNPASFVDPQGMYEVDVHFYMTYFLAAKVGFDLADSYTIAGSTQFVDNSPRTHPLTTASETLLTFHFAQEPTGRVTRIHPGARGGKPFALREYKSVQRNTPAANRIFDMALEEGDLFMAGIGLHLLQDSYAHEGFGWEGPGHLWSSLFGANPDNPRNNPGSGEGP